MPSPIFDAMNRQPAIPPSPPNQGKLDLIKQYNSFRQDPFTFMLQQQRRDETESGSSYEYGTVRAGKAEH